MKSHGEIARFSYYERLVHWWVGLSFSYLLITGLAFAYPRFFFVLDLFGGAALSRVLHPWVGMFFTVGLVLMYFTWVKEMWSKPGDREWLGAVRHYARHEKDQVPATGKYNPGQKIFFWAQIFLGIAHLVTGIPMWFPHLLGTGVVPTMRFIHFFVTLPGLLLLIAHVYLGTILFPGTARGMLYGRVTRAWARLHHPSWAREQTED